MTMTTRAASVVSVAAAVAALLMAPVTLGAVGSAAESAVESTVESMWRQSFPLSPYGVVTVENIRGSVRIIGWDRAEAVVEIRKLAAGKAGKDGSDANLDAVGVDIVTSTDALTLRTMLTDPAGVDVTVNYTLRIPRQAVVRYAGTLEGNVELAGLSGAVSAQVLNGNIIARNLSGDARLRANNGDVAASFLALPPPDGAVLLESITGDVTVELPPGADADLSLETVTGEVATLYPVLASEALADFSVRVRAGRGGLKISLVTVKGNIRVRERSDSL